MARAKKPAKLTASADVLQSLLQNGKSPLSDQFLRWKLWRRWPQVVGFAIAEHTTPVGFNGGTLYVWVRTASWLQELSFIAEPLREKVNTFAGPNWAKRIQFTLDRRSVPGAGEMEKDAEGFLE